MTNVEFVEVTTRIENYYEKELNEHQRKFWFEQLKNMPVQNYRKIITELMRTCKYMPKFADVTEIIKNIKFETTAIQKEKIEVPCKICGGIGLIKWFKQIENGDSQLRYEYYARCNCENSKNFEWRDKEGNLTIPSALELNLI